MTIKTKIIALMAAWMLISSCNENPKTQVQTDNPNLQKKIDEYIKAWIKKGKFNGSLLIAKGDSILYNNSFGLAQREFKIPNTTSTKYLIGSITKPFTAYAILLLEKEGKLSLDDKLSKYLPQFPNAESITIYHLLTHKSGVTDYHAFDNWEINSKLAPTPHSTLKTILKRPSEFQPGKKFSYSNTGYIILGLIIEQVSGLSFRQFIQKEITEPLKLHDTGVASNTTIIENLASGYTTNPRETKHTSYIDYNQAFTSGNMYSTTLDLWKFTQALMQSNLLSQEKTNEIFTCEKHYGYGWGIRNFDGLKAYGHYGRMNGYVASLSYIPKDEYFVCYLTNDDNTPQQTLTKDLLQLIQGKNPKLPVYRQLVPLTNNMKSMVLGNYLVKPGDTLKVFELNESLYMQETGQTKHELFPVDSLEFEFALFDFTVAFSKPNYLNSDTLKFVGSSELKAIRQP